MKWRSCTPMISQELGHEQSCTFQPNFKLWETLLLTPLGVHELNNSFLALCSPFCNKDLFSSTTPCQYWLSLCPISGHSLRVLYFVLFCFTITPPTSFGVCLATLVNVYIFELLWAVTFIRYCAVNSNTSRFKIIARILYRIHLFDLPKHHQPD